MKSTVEGILGALLPILGAILAFQVPTALNPAVTHVWVYVTAVALLLSAVARALLGYLQNDAPPATPIVANLQGDPNAGGRIGTGPIAKAVVLVCFLSLAMLPLCAFSCSGSQQQQAANASLKASDVVETAQATEIALYQQGVIPMDEHTFLEQQFDTLAHTGTAVDSCIGSASQKDGVFTCLNTAITSVDQINAEGGLQLKSAQAKATFQAAIVGVRTALATIEITLGGTPPPVPAPQ